ncbi:MAG TPA: FIST N-terminal domain-containing protein [Deltaproteobacteria bacterium]|nr:FIST N-terminal domain-containing protein [Deltaproteobacteria bacterium]
MRIEQRRWRSADDWTAVAGANLREPPQLVLIFGARGVMKDHGLIGQIMGAYPGAHYVGCSTAGEISGTEVSDDSVVTTAIHFAHTCIHGGKIALRHAGESYQAGAGLARTMPPEGLRHVLVFSDGLSVNGSDLVRGLTDHLPKGVTVTGGLAGDGASFTETLIMWDGMPEGGAVAAVGFYGDRLRVGFGSQGGWDPFGPERLITRSEGNVLYELDGRSALDLYRKYLGEHAGGLPATGLLFPLSLRLRPNDTPVVRTILGVNEAEKSLTFAGDVPEGSSARLMKANIDRLIDGAVGAAHTSFSAVGPVSPELAVLISCVGRKLVLKQRVEEEVEGVCGVLGGSAVITGFYSYGEIAPFMQDARCELHNQTMTVTTFSEGQGVGK